jgi:transcriptional regulator with XRE-family HTH domain
MSYDFDVLRQLRQRRNLTISSLSKLCGVSYVVLSKLEHNQGNPELRTLDRIAKALGMSTHNLLVLAEHPEPVTATERTCQVLGSGQARLIEMNGIRLYVVRAPAGAAGDHNEPHRDDYEHCFVLSGCLQLTVRGNLYRLGPGQGLMWDAQMDHHYSVLEPSSFIMALAPKRL